MKYVMAFMFLVVPAGIAVLADDLTRDGKSAPQIAPQPPAIHLTMLGDSIIAMMAPQQPTLPPPFKSAVNLGVGGQDTTSIKKQVASIPATTTHVLLEGGINNYFLGTSASIFTDYAAILDAIPASMRVIVLGITQVDESAYGAEHQVWKTLFSNPRIADTDFQINALCASHSNCVVATEAQNLSMVGRTIDGLHPNAAGYAALAPLISAIVSE
jgi:GDSL-like Lipase/Acylhydrolase family